jgi:Tol biopolymer transport system component/DNA-binding winged helix-turn-helix (wHTH) protein
MGNRAVRMLNLGPAGNSQPNSNGNASTRRFGVFELDLRSGELRRNGMKVKLQEQPLQVLAQLLERPGEVVTRDDLHCRLWPADTFVDFDHSLNAAIRRLRDALGDSAENPTFVETVARRGYRFMAPVSAVPVSGNGELNDTQEVQTVPVAALRHPWWIAALVTALVLILLGISLGFHLARNVSAPYGVTQLTANPLDDPVRAAAISRDGRYLAFSDDNGFYLRQIETGETHPIHLPDGLLATAISWFPDSVHMVVAFIGSDRESSLWELSALGGTARRIIDDGCNPSVSPDGKSLAFVAGKMMRQRIWISGIAGDQARELAGEDGDEFGRIAWSPNGSRIAYTTTKFTYGYGGKGSIALTRVRGTTSGNRSASAPLLSMFGLNAPLSWASDGRLIYAVEEPRPRQMDSNLWAVQLDGQMKQNGTPVRLTNDQGAVLSVNTSGDTKRIAYVKGVPEPDVYVANLQPSGMIDEPQRLTLDDRQDLPYDWTPDNKEVIFASDRTGTFNVYKQAVDQAVPDLLVAGNQPALIPRLSPDGTQIIYIVYPNWGEPNYQVPLMRVPLAGGPPQQIVAANWLGNHQCARAPAHLCLYTVLSDKDLTFFSFDPMRGPGSQVYQIKDEAPQMYNWSLSPDGTTLAIAKGKWGGEEPRIHLVSLKGEPERWLTIRGWPGVSGLDWAADSKGLWAASTGEKENTLLHIDLRGNVRPVWRAKNKLVGWAIPSRDGKRLALHIHSVSANVWMLDRP